MSKDFATILDESIDYLNNSKCLENQYGKIIKESESLIKFIKDYDNNNYNNKEELKKVIGESLVNVIETHAEVSQELDKLAELLILKNADYGSSFFDVADDLGVISIAVRLSDKVNRLKQLTQGSEDVDIKVSDESIEDTVVDLEGYMLLSICWLSVTKKQETDELLIPLCKRKERDKTYEWIKYIDNPWKDYDVKC